MKFMFLGTSGAEGVPAAFCSCPLCKNALKENGKSMRLRSAALIDGRLLLDLSPDLVAMRRTRGFDPLYVSAVVQTHTHHDHFAPQLLSYLSATFALPPPLIDLYGSRHMLKSLESFPLDKKEVKCFTPRAVYPFIPFLHMSYTVTPLKANHGAADSLIYLIEKDGKSILYATDSGLLPDETAQYLAGRGITLAVFDGGNGPSGDNPGHMTYAQIAQTADTLRQTNALSGTCPVYATHLPHRGGHLHAETQALLSPLGIIAAYDGLEVEV